MREHCIDQVHFSRDSGQKWITGERMSSEMDISVTNDYLNIFMVTNEDYTPLNYSWSPKY